MGSIEGHEEPVPGIDVGSDATSSELLFRLEVDGEVFAVKSRGGGTDYDWISGPNEGYGFGLNMSPDVPEEEHLRSIRSFLDMIDPATGYIAED